jgi:3D (Asp-Asp-Asp) domain-containing protein
MKVYKNLARIAAVAAAACSVTVSVSAHSDYLIKVNALTGPTPSIVDFSGHDPVITDTDSLVPVRQLAQETGMFASWDQPTQTATITLYSCAWGENQVERYASELMGQVNTYGLDVTPYSITADFTLNDNIATLKYNFKESDGDIVSVGKDVKINDAATLVNDGTLMVPLKSSMEMFGLEVELDNEDDSAEISIPDSAVAPTDMRFVADKKEAVQEEAVEASVATSVTVAEDDAVNMDPKLGTYLGRFKITHYCPCNTCNGGWGAYTAWAGKIIPGQTIAVDPTVIPKLATVYIDGYGYRIAEDCGGAVKGNHIDMAVSSHAEVNRLGVVYKDVYLSE